MYVTSEKIFELLQVSVTNIVLNIFFIFIYYAVILSLNIVYLNDYNCIVNSIIIITSLITLLAAFLLILAFKGRNNSLFFSNIISIIISTRMSTYTYIFFRFLSFCIKNMIFLDEQFLPCLYTYIILN